uniref:Uncharacterized protein n=1 Tax=Rhizophora mucronata TaxID=61149 RepID=A0A2P2N6B6_RHIMU
MKETLTSNWSWAENRNFSPRCKLLLFLNSLVVEQPTCN